MNLDISKLLKILKALRLKPEEKAHVREQLWQFIRDNPVRTDGLARREQQRADKALGSNKIPLMGFLHFVGSYRTMSIFLVIALLVGGGISAAAEGALPGDLLFPVKVTVNDNIRSALAVSNESQAKLDAKLAQRRLEEAEKLALEGKLEAEAQAVAEMYFEQRVASAREHLIALEEEGETGTAIEIGSDLESSLRVHENILLALQNKEEVRAVVKPLVAKVRSNTQAVSQTRLEAESDLAAGVSLGAGAMSQQNDNSNNAVMKTENRTEVGAAANNRLAAAENKMAEVRKYIQSHWTELKAEAIAEAEARLKVADSTIAEGKAKLEAKAYVEAFILFQKAHRITQEAKLLLEAERELKIDLRVDTKAEGRVESDPRLISPPNQNNVDLKVNSGTRIELK